MLSAHAHCISHRRLFYRRFLCGRHGSGTPTAHPTTTRLTRPYNVSYRHLFDCPSLVSPPTAYPLPRSDTMFFCNNGIFATSFHALAFLTAARSIHLYVDSMQLRWIHNTVLNGPLTLFGSRAQPLLRCYLYNDDHPCAARMLPVRLPRTTTGCCTLHLPQNTTRAYHTGRYTAPSA